MSDNALVEGVTRGRQIEDLRYDVVVIGGGVAGVCAAVAAARLGTKVALLQDRPVFGGNSSSEVRVWAIGAATRGYFRNSRETGIIEEVSIDAAYRNEGLLPITGEAFPMWDMVLKEACDREHKHLDYYLNTRAYEVAVAGDKITSITALQISTERAFRFHAPLFIDSSGDGEIGYRAGAIWRLGHEARHEFGESLAPPEANTTVLPSTITFTARDVGYPVKFHPPEWAYDFPTDADMPFRDHSYVKSGYWWLSAGGNRDTINDNEAIRDELYKILFGVWDHIKNHGDHGADNLVLDWVGHVVGKRESRRFEGDYVLRQDDVLYGRRFPDAIAFGGWPVDLHPSQGFFSQDVPTDQIEPEKPYDIPYRALYSRNIENLFLNGRLVSCSHIAMGSVRVQKTLGIVGQAVGTAAHLCLQTGQSPRQLGQQPSCIHQLQQMLLKQDCYIPHVRNADPDDLALTATVTASSHMPLPEVEPDGQHPLYTRRAQKFMAPAGQVERVWAQLVSERGEAVSLRAHLRSAPELWDFAGSEVLATAEAVLAPGQTEWVVFEFNQAVEAERPCWLEIEPAEGVAWRHSLDEPHGCQAAAWSDKRFVRLKLDAAVPKFAIEADSDDGVWRHLRGTYLIRVEPQPYPYGPENVINGVSRPEQGANVWMADPSQPWPHWLELDFQRPVTFNTLQLTLDSNLDRMMDEGAKALTGPIPEIVKQYSVLAWRDGQWQTVFQEANNIQRWRRHTFAPVTTQKLRLVCEAMHVLGLVETKPREKLIGPQMAHPTFVRVAHTPRIFEVRVYNEPI